MTQADKCQRSGHIIHLKRKSPKRLLGRIAMSCERFRLSKMWYSFWITLWMYTNTLVLCYIGLKRIIYIIIMWFSAATILNSKTLSSLISTDCVYLGTYSLWYLKEVSACFGHVGLVGGRLPDKNTYSNNTRMETSVEWMRIADNGRHNARGRDVYYSSARMCGVCMRCHLREIWMIEMRFPRCRIAGRGKIKFCIKQKEKKIP